MRKPLDIPAQFGWLSEGMWKQRCWLARNQEAVEFKHSLQGKYSVARLASDTGGSW